MVPNTGSKIGPAWIHSVAVPCESFGPDPFVIGAFIFPVGSVPRVSPPSGTVELNRTSSVNLTCVVDGQPGVHVEWYKNRRRIPAPPMSQIHRTLYGNGSVRSELTLSRVKYKDRGSIISCSAWYPTLSINSTRNILLLVHGRTPRDFQSPFPPTDS